jgi:hypothetical protein
MPINFFHLELVRGRHSCPIIKVRRTRRPPHSRNRKVHHSRSLILHLLPSPAPNNAPSFFLLRYSRSDPRLSLSSLPTSVAFISGPPDPGAVLLSTLPGKLFNPLGALKSFNSCLCGDPYAWVWTWNLFPTRLRASYSSTDSFSFCAAQIFHMCLTLPALALVVRIS